MPDEKADANHRLAIDKSTLVPEDTEWHEMHSTHLREFEMIQGVPFTFRFILKNKADQPFPGGRLKNVKVKSVSTGLSSITRTIEEDYRINAMEREFDDKTEIIIPIGAIQTTGDIILTFEAEADDENHVEIHTSMDPKESESYQEEFIRPIYVANRFELQTLDELRNIKEQLANND